MEHKRGSVVSRDEFATESELYGVSPGVIAIIMFIITGVVPIGFIPETTFIFEPMIYSLFWVFPLSHDFFGFPFAMMPVVFLNPFVIFLTLPLTILNVNYAIWVVRYYKNQTSRYTAIMMGMLSMILPVALAIYLSAMFGTLMLVYPIPIQFIIGLVLLWKIEGPEVISPWSGMRLDLSWWKRGGKKRKSDWDPFEKERNIAEKDDWLEG